MEKNTQIILHHDLSKEVNKMLADMKFKKEDVRDMINKRVDEFMKPCMQEVLEQKFRWDDSLMATAVDRVIVCRSIGKDDPHKFQQQLNEKINQEIKKAVDEQIRSVIEVMIKPKESMDK